MRKLTLNEFVEKASLKHGDKYNYDRVIYVNNRTPIIIECPLHGCFSQIAGWHLSGYGCPTCGGTERLTTEKAVETLMKVRGDEYDYSKVEYKNSKEKIKIICRTHGEFQQTYHSHKAGHGCPKCRSDLIGEMNCHDFETFREKAVRKHGEKYDYSKVKYVGSTVKVSIICPTHGEFKQRPDMHTNEGQGCPKCSNSGVSKAETEVFDFVRSICPDAVQSDRTIIGPLELDVVVPSHNLAIEFNGLYWHDERTKDKKYHITKRHRVEAAGYRLISIREDVWNERREQVENIIRNALGVTSDKVFARKCNIVEVSTSEAKAFMEKHHVQGFRGATAHYGLQHDDTLVAVISLTNWQKKNEWELVRYATACNVPGGLSRLWKHATTVNNIVRAYSYVDRDLFTGSSYVHAGFTLSTTTVGFRIVNGCTTESREKWNRAPDGMTQTQWYESEGVSRIYDSGQDKLLWVK